MSLRLIEVFLPQDQEKEIKNFLRKFSPLGIWHEPLSDRQLSVKILLDPTEVETVVNRLLKHFENTDDFQLLLLPVEASLPQPRDKSASASINEQINLDPTSSRIAREEIYTRVNQDVRLSWTHLLLVIISSIIAAIGLERNSETVIIGAMVIAPLLKPNMALAVATTLGDLALALRTIVVGAVGISLALGFALLTGLVFPIDPDLPQIAMRTQVSLADIILALTSGVAGAISLTAGERSAIVGVMVSVALLPPLVTWGMLLGSGQWHLAFDSMLLVLTNITCLNLAAIATLLIQDVRPRNWWKLPQAKQMTQIASGVWFVLLLTIVSAIFLMEWKNGI